MEIRGKTQEGRMSDTAAHLVDHVFPHVPVRKWVLTLPIPLRYRSGG
jgi:hypothetical protein